MFGIFQSWDTAQCLYTGSSSFNVYCYDRWTAPANTHNTEDTDPARNRAAFPQLRPIKIIQHGHFHSTRYYDSLNGKLLLLAASSVLISLLWCDRIYLLFHIRLTLQSQGSSPEMNIEER